METTLPYVSSFRSQVEELIFGPNLAKIWPKVVGHSRRDLVGKSAVGIYTPPEFNIAAHREGYRVTSLHIGNGWATL